MTSLREHDTNELSLGRRETSAFDVVLRGYDREQVEERLLQWAEALDSAEDQRDAAMQEVAAARAAAARQSPAEQLSERMRQILVLAEQDAERIRAEAEAEVRDAVDRARSEAAAVRDKAHAELRRDRLAAQGETERMLAEAQREAEQILGSARAEAEDLALHTARTREEAHAEHERLVATQQADAIARGEQLRQEIVELEQRRDEVGDQIDTLRDSLASVGSFRRA